MPLPMVHLAVAVRIQNLVDRNSFPNFLLGSIAPDAIHMRPGSGPDDKQRVHLSESDDLLYERARLLCAQKRSDRAGFAEGYAAHILTDDLWRKTVGASFRKSIMSLSSPLDGRALYYLETDQIDFDLFHQMPWRKAVWSMLATTQPADFAGLLSAEEITRWRDRTLNWFEKLKIEPGIVPVHITYSDVQVFINQATGETLKIFKMWRNM